MRTQAEQCAVATCFTGGSSSRRQEEAALTRSREDETFHSHDLERYCSDCSDWRAAEGGFPLDGVTDRHICETIAAVTYLVEFPVEGGGRLVVQAAAEELPGSLDLAARRPGEIVAKARTSVEQVLDQVGPAVDAVLGRLRALSPAEVTVEFGILLSAETGAIIAKGSADVHFNVTLAWSPSAGQSDSSM
jgi:hypothetical protein